MNIIAVDFGNSNVNICLYLEDKPQPAVSISTDDIDSIVNELAAMWQQIPVMKTSTEGKRDGVIAYCSVTPKVSDEVAKQVKEETGEKMLEIGVRKDIPLPIDVKVESPAEVGVDRILSAAAAYMVVGNAVVVADIGSAITIDMVDDDGVFVGGIICPGMAMSASALHDHTAKLPEVEVKKPSFAVGMNTNDAISNGIYYATVGVIETVSRKFAEELGVWPQTVVTGGGAAVVKDDLEFVDTWVSGLVTSGIVLAYKKYIDELEG